MLNNEIDIAPAEYLPIIRQTYALKLALFMNRSITDITLAKCQLDSEGTQGTMSVMEPLIYFTKSAIFIKLLLLLLNVYLRTMHFQDLICPKTLKSALLDYLHYLSQ